MPKTKRSRNLRSQKGYRQRKVGTREIKQRFLIVCEGTKTEPNYFKAFRVPKDVLTVCGTGKNPSHVVQEAKQKVEKDDDYDQVWCVFDRDDFPPQDFTNAIHSAKSAGFKVAYSNEAFELWYVLHFEFLNAGIPRKDYQQKLTQHLGQEYQKNNEAIYTELLSKQKTAIANAKRLLCEYDPVQPAQDNPSTTVHLLVQELNRFIS